MKHPLRYTLCGLAAAVVLGCGAYALGGGDSLVTLSYLNGTFLPAAQSKGEAAGSQKLQQTYDSAKQTLDRIYQEKAGPARRPRPAAPWPPRTARRARCFS